MKAVLFPGDRQVQIVDRPTPTIGYGQVLIKSRASAICRSDMGLYSGAYAVVGGDSAGKGQIIPGHESAGEIVQVGPGVDHLKIGDRVAVHLAFGCGHCSHCLSGFTMLCSSWKCLGFDVDGGNADYVALPAANALLLPDEISFAGGAVMTDMIGSQYYLQQKLHVAGNKRVAVIGLGPMGAAATLIASGLGAEVIAIDIIEERLKFSKTLGATHALDSRDANIKARILEITKGAGVEVAIDCSGSPIGQNLALDIAGKHGAVAFVGESSKTEINPSDQIIRKLLTVVGGWYFPLSAWSEICDFVLSRKLNVEGLISHRFTLDQAAEAFDKFDKRETEKAVFIWND
ncbi:alcohol dehydrogenase catalytic domain-containing protein [Candidatus Planktophila versatilis]|uniref:alcohol dehydrogenase catalytic domain-containing protein n=1 Tax=Candidatus Planktophila versatilis TaxID=1884905 RepID=UPI003CF07D11